MEENVGVRKLVELIFVKKLKVTDDMRALDSPFPPFLVTNDFTTKLQSILVARNALFAIKHSVDSDYVHRIKDDPKAYISKILKVCVKDYFSHLNVFDSFLSACSIVMCVSYKVLRAGVNFCDLNYDLVMVYYDTFLKEVFLKSGGFLRLVEQIENHRYLSWNMNKIDLRSIDSISASLDAVLFGRLRKELHIEDRTSKTAEVGVSDIFYLSKLIDHVTITLLSTLLSLRYSTKKAAMVKPREETIKAALLTTSVELPNLPSDPLSTCNKVSTKKNTANTTEADLLTTCVELSNLSSDPLSTGNKVSTKKNAAKTIEADLLTTSVELPNLPSYSHSTGNKVSTKKNEPKDDPQKNSNSNSKTDNSIKKKEDITFWDFAVTEVINYNNLNSPSFVCSESSILKKAEKIVIHLKSTIQSFIEILDE